MRVKENDYERKLFAILLAGFLLKLCYIAVVPYGISKHDLGSFTLTGFSDTDEGHLGFISYLYTFRRLPDFDPRLIWGFYNPPGFHILAALWYGINRRRGFAPLTCLENLQILTLIFVSVGICVTVKILEELFEKDRYLLYTAAFLSFFPFFTILSGTLNNDALAFLCSMTAVLYAIRWYRDQSVKNIVLIAVSLGFGMFTKLNVGLLSFPIGFLFLYALVKRRKEAGKMILQFGLVGLICVPLGLFWPIRNYMRFGMPMNYIPDLKSKRQYVGNFSIFQRIGIPSWENLSSPFLSFAPGQEHNIWTQLVKTALFDEVPRPGEMPVFRMCAQMLFWLGLLGAACAVVSWIRTLLDRNSMASERKAFFTIQFLSMLIGYVPFCFSYPYICTMNFRYIIPLLLLPCLSWESIVHRAGERTRRLQTVGMLLFVFLCLLANLALIIME